MEGGPRLSLGSAHGEGTPAAGLGPGGAGPGGEGLGAHAALGGRREVSHLPASGQGPYGVGSEVQSGIWMWGRRGSLEPEQPRAHTHFSKEGGVPTVHREAAGRTGAHRGRGSQREADAAGPTQPARRGHCGCRVPCASKCPAHAAVTPLGRLQKHYKATLWNSNFSRGRELSRRGAGGRADSPQARGRRGLATCL